MTYPSRNEVKPPTTKEQLRLRGCGDGFTISGRRGGPQGKDHGGKDWNWVRTVRYLLQEDVNIDCLLLVVLFGGVTWGLGRQLWEVWVQGWERAGTGERMTAAEERLLGRA